MWIFATAEVECSTGARGLPVSAWRWGKHNLSICHQTKWYVPDSPNCGFCPQVSVRAGCSIKPAACGHALSSCVNVIIKVYEMWPVVGWGFVLFWVSFKRCPLATHFRRLLCNHGFLTGSKNVAVKVFFEFVVWKEPCKGGCPGGSISLQPDSAYNISEDSQAGARPLPLA